MAAHDKREFVFTTQLDNASLPFLKTALQGTMTAYGFDEDKASEAAKLLTNYISGLAMPVEPTELHFALQYDNSGGSMTIHTSGALDLSGLCDVIAKSHAWNAHVHCCDESSNVTEIIVVLKKE